MAIPNILRIIFGLVEPHYAETFCTHFAHNNYCTETVYYIVIYRKCLSNVQL